MSLVVLALGVMAGAIQAAETGWQSEVAALEETRKSAMEDGRKPLIDLDNKYREALEKRKATAQAAGDLDGVTAATTELEHLAKGNDTAPIPKDPALARLKNVHAEQKVKMLAAVTSRLLEVEREMAEGLEGLVAEMTKAGRIEDAKAVRGYRDAFIEDFKARRATIATGGSGVAEMNRPGDERKFEIAPGMMIDFCWIPPGEFIMGNATKDSGDNDAEPNDYRVTISRGFWMAKTELTQAQWRAVAGTDPGHHPGDNRPVEQVCWLDICGDDSRSGGFLGKVNKVAPDAWRFDLPTEAEWEYACRAGTRSQLNNGKDPTSEDGVCDELGELGWYIQNSKGGTQPVGLKKPNAWGLHDMHGNVWEWCIDWFGRYPTGGTTDPTGPASGDARIFRGGSWRHKPSAARSDSRSSYRPNFRYLTLGFRLVLKPVPGARVAPPVAKAEDVPDKVPATAKAAPPLARTADLDADVPIKTPLPPEFEVEVVSEDPVKSEYVYGTPHFEFISDKRLTSRVVSGFGILYEATYEAVLSMPWGAELDPGPGRKRFPVRLFSSEEDFLKAGGMKGSAGTAIGPLSLVQMKYLGLRDTGTRILLDDIKENHVVIHELTHALRSEADLKLPVWAIEGFAEYIASATYERAGCFSFKDRLRDVVNHLKERRGTGDSFRSPLDLEQLLGVSREIFYGDAHGGLGDGALKNYSSALLVLTWFWHEDQGKDGLVEKGAPVRAWLTALHEGKSEAEARSLLLDGRSHQEVERAIAASYRRELAIEFGDP